MDFFQELWSWFYANRNEIATWVTIIGFIPAIEYFFKPFRRFWNYLKPPTKTESQISPEPPPAEYSSNPLFNVPIPKNPYFTARDQELKNIENSITQQPIALVGLGGVGKSHTAAHFAYLHEKKYQAVLWIFADTQQNLINNFGQLALQVSEWIDKLQLEVYDSSLLLNKIAFYLDTVKANYSQALPLYQRSLAILRAVFDENHPNVQTVKNNYERCLQAFEQNATD